MRNPALRRGWDWCGVVQCRSYRTECQKLRDRFDNAELEYTRSLHSEAKDTEPVPHDECRPECDDNGDFELVQHCNRQFKKTEESTGACVTWDNNGEHQDFVYNRVEKICEKYSAIINIFGHYSEPSTEPRDNPKNLTSQLAHICGEIAAWRPP